MRFLVTNNFSGELEGVEVGDVIDLDVEAVPAWGIGKLEEAPQDAQVSERKPGKQGGKGGGKGGKPGGEVVKQE